MQTAQNIYGRYKDYITYFLKTRFKFNIHSPFVYDFVDRVLEDFTHYPEYDTIENIRKAAIQNNQVVNKSDYSKLTDGKHHLRKTTVSKIARKASIDREESRLLYRIVRYYRPTYLLELGTSLGISTISQALGSKNVPFENFYTIEGSEEVHKVAREIRDLAAENKKILNNVQYVQGPFDTTLPAILEKMPRVDYVFFDGNHHKDALLHYFNLCLEKADENSIFVIDDIYQSRGMKKAWETIKVNQNVRTTVDLFRLGIVFFNNPYARQNFTIRF